MGEALRVDALSEAAALDPAVIDAISDAISDAASDAVVDAARALERKQQARDQNRFCEFLEPLVCEKVNSHFWLSAPQMKQRAATPALFA